MFGITLLLSLILSVCLTSIYIVTIARLFKFMKNNFYKEWHSLGEPSIFMNNSIGNFFRLFNYLRLRKYERNNSKNLSKLCKKTWDLMLLTLFTTFVTMILGGMLIIPPIETWEFVLFD